MAIASEGDSAYGCREVAEEIGVVGFRLVNQLFVRKALHYLGETTGTARKCVIRGFRAHTRQCAYERLQHFHLSKSTYQVDSTPSQLLMNRSPFPTGPTQ